MKANSSIRCFFIAAVAGMMFVLTANAGEHGRHLFILSGQSNMAGLDPDISFTPTVKKALGDDNVIVVKDAQSGQPISRWYKHNKEAESGDKKPETRGDLYVRLIKNVQSAIEGEQLLTVTFVWMQGESDVRETVGVYGECLAGLIGESYGTGEVSVTSFITGIFSPAISFGIDTRIPPGVAPVSTGCPLSRTSASTTISLPGVTAQRCKYSIVWASSLRSVTFPKD